MNASIEDNQIDLLTASGREAAPIERRRDAQRRHRGDRRKNITRSVGLEVSPSGVSIAIIEDAGQETPRRLLTRYVEFPDNSGPTKGDWTDGTLTKIVGDLCDEYYLSGCAAFVGLDGSPCMTRVVMGTNDDVDHDVRELTERSRHYMGMGRGEKVRCQIETRIDAKRKRAWVTIAKKAAVDAIATAVKQAGMRLCRIEHSMVVLCRALGNEEADTEAPVLLVSQERGRLEMGISYRGQLLLDYRPAMPDSNVSEVEVVCRHIKCLRRYLQAKLTDCQAELVQAVMTGIQRSPSSDDDVAQGLENLRITKFPVASLVRGLEVESSFSEDPGMLTAISLARGNETAASAESTNDLLLTLKLASGISWKKLLNATWPCIAAAVVACMLSVSAWDQSNRTLAVEQQVAALMPTRAEASRLRSTFQKQTILEQEVERFASQLPTAEWNKILYQSGSLLPKGVWLDSVQIDHGANVRFVGTSFGAKNIYEYIGRLKDAGLFRRVSLESTGSIMVAGQSAMTFEITADAAQESPESEASENLTGLYERGRRNG